MRIAVKYLFQLGAQNYSTLALAVCTIFSCNTTTEYSPPVSFYKKALVWQQVYDSILKIEKKTDTILYKQYALDSIIFNKEYLQSDSTGLQILRNSYYNRAYDYNTSRNFFEAKNDHEHALAIAEKIGFRDDTQKYIILNQLANIYNRLGDITMSLNYRKQQLDFLRSIHDTDNIGRTLLNYGILYDDVGKYDEAIKLFKEGLQSDSISSYTRAKLNAQFAASLMNAGQYDSSFHVAHVSLNQLKAFQASSDTLNWLSLNYSTLSRIYHVRNEKSKAKMHYYMALQSQIKVEDNFRIREVGKLLLLFSDLGSVEASSIHNIQLSLYTVSNVDTTNIFSLPLKNEINAENTIMEALDAKAEWMTKYFQPEEKVKYLTCAADCYDLAFEVERKLLLNFSYDESKIRMLKESRHRSEKAIAVCYELYQATGNRQWIDRAFRFAERNKAFIVLESIRRNLAVSGQVQRDSLYQQTAQLQMQYAFAERQWLEAKIADDTAGIAALEREKNGADEKLQMAKTTLYQNNTAYRQVLEKEDSIGTDGASSLLPDSASALVEYFTGDSASYAFVIQKDKPHRMLSISNDNLPAIDSFLHFFADKNSIISNLPAYRKQAYGVYEKWLLPCIGDKRIQSLLIIPDDKLSLVPFDALLTQATDAQKLKDLPYLIYRFQTSYAYSAATLLKQQQVKQTGEGVLAFAPVFDEADRRQLPPLPFSRDETDVLRRQSNATVYENSKASVQNFRQASGIARILHIASHAHPGLKADPSTASIELADSSLYLNELYALKLHADLVVLSACETGVGKIEESEGPLSLARGFYYAGAKNVITSLWAVNDQSTALIFTDFYQQTTEHDFAGSLHRAKLSYLKSDSANDKHSPFYWAAFVNIGASQAPVEKGPDWWLFLFVITGIGLLVAGYIAYTKSGVCSYVDDNQFDYHKSY